MADRLKRGSAPGRARSEDQRPGSFKKGHKKRGGRQRGTPNKFSCEYKKQIFEAANGVGMDAAGTLGIVGYLRWIARHHPRIMGGLLGSLMELQELEIGQPQEPRRTAEQLNEVAAYFGFGSNDETQPEPAEPRSAPDWTGRKNWTRRQTEPTQTPSTRKRTKSKEQTQKANQPPDPDLPWAWTGRDDPVGRLMHGAITDPKEFGALLQATLPRPTALQRGLAARRAWEERRRAEERRRTEQHPGVAS
jgi:hypothetical protein